MMQLLSLVVAGLLGLGVVVSIVFGLRFVVIPVLTDVWSWIKGVDRPD